MFEDGTKLADDDYTNLELLPWASPIPSPQHHHHPKGEQLENILKYYI
jgi:hypothetical protein